MTRFAYMSVLATFLSVGFGIPMIFAGDPPPVEDKEKKDVNGGKADDDKKKDEKKDMGDK